MRRVRGPTCATHRAKSSGRCCARDLRPHRSLCRLAIDWTSPPRFASSWRVRGGYAFRNRRGWRIISSLSSAAEVDANGPSTRDEKSCHASERHADTTANDQVLTPPQIRRLRSGVIRRASDSGGLFLLPLQARHESPEITSRLSPGLTTDEVLELVGPPQRRGQNLFDKKKEYWIYEFVKQQKSKKRSGNASRNGQETVLDSEVQLLFERGKLVNWNVVPIKN